MKTTTHRGEALEAAFRKRGFKISQLSRLLNVSRSTIYGYFERPDLDIEIIDKVAKIIGWDYVPAITDVSSEVYSALGEGPSVSALATCREELGRTARQLAELQQKHITALERLEAYQRTYGPLTS